MRDSALSAGRLRPAAQVAGICGYEPVSPALAPAWKSNSTAISSSKTTRRNAFAGIYGACGTRTRHLRLAKLYSAFPDEPGQAGITGESRHFVRGLAGIAGFSRGLPAAACGMYAGWIRCLFVQQAGNDHALRLETFTSECRPSCRWSSAFDRLPPRCVRAPSPVVTTNWSPLRLGFRRGRSEVTDGVLRPGPGLVALACQLVPEQCLASCGIHGVLAHEEVELQVRSA
jgi:hypothetical protein